MAVALNANALITLVELDEILKITIGDADLSNTLINIASDFIERYCNRKFISQVFTDEIHDGDGGHNIFLENPLVTAVDNVKSWDSISNILIQTFTENTHYLIYLDEGYIYLRGRTSKGHRNYRVTYTAGYVTVTAVPYDLKNACAQFAGFINSQTGSAGAKSETIGKYSITYGSSGSISINGIPAPESISGVIIQYRKFNI